jgi:hypothetical protein
LIRSSAVTPAIAISCIDPRRNNPRNLVPKTLRAA